MPRSGCARAHFRGFPRGRVAIVTAAGCTFRRSALLAQRAGASAVLVAEPGDRPPVAGTLIRSGVRLPVLAVRSSAVRRLARRTRPVRVAVDALTERRVSHNLLAELPGTRAGRVVMAGAHIDSVPEGPGINDNGSGVAALVESGLRLAQRPRGRRTVRLAFWAAEEPGLFGSRRYVRRLPRAERRRIAGYLNLDMVGSPNGVPQIYGSSRALKRALRRHLPRAGRTDLRGASDHAPFSAARIPVAGIYTGSLERKTRRQARRWGGTPGRPRDACYHRACDRLGNVSLRLLSRTATAAAAALEDLAR